MDHGAVVRARSESARRVGRSIESPPAHWSLLALLLGGLLLLLGVQGLSTRATGRSATATTSAADPALRGSAAIWRIEGDRLAPSERPVGRRIALTFDDGPDRAGRRGSPPSFGGSGSRRPSSWSASTWSGIPPWWRAWKTKASSWATTPSTTSTWPQWPAGSATYRFDDRYRDRRGGRSSPALLPPALLGRPGVDHPHERGGVGLDGRPGPPDRALQLRLRGLAAARCRRRSCATRPRPGGGAA